MFFGASFEVLYTIAHDIGRNGEPESLCRHTLRGECHFSGTDPDQSPRDIDHRAAAVAWINRRVRLHQIFVIYVVDADVALGRTQHPAANRAAVADGVTDHENGFAQQVGRNVVEVDEREL